MEYFENATELEMDVFRFIERLSPTYEDILHHFYYVDSEQEVYNAAYTLLDAGMVDIFDDRWYTLQSDPYDFDIYDIDE